MRRKIKTAPVLALLLAALTLVAAACSGDDDSDPGAGNPEPAASAEDFERALTGAPPALAEVYAQGNAIVEGGVEAFEAQLAELEGHPVVVNKWASWCGPCRFEFPFFQSQAIERGKEVAFLGVDSSDETAAAETFLRELPLPYPSFSDPDNEIAALFDPRNFPATAFYDSSGELAFVRGGGYGSEQDLAADIERYAK